MLGIPTEQPFLPVWFTLGLLTMFFALTSWRLRRKWAQASHDIVHLRQVVQDLISIQEHNLANLRAEITGHQSGASRKILPLKTQNSEIIERKRYIWNLAEKGLSADEITKRMNLPRGQVELLLNMRSYAGSASA